MNSNYEVLPSLAAPVTHRKKMQSAFLLPQNDGDLSLYPFDGIGIYDKSRFIEMGGFDTSLNNTYWQLMDFGFRAFLWGEEIALNIHLKLSYNGNLPVENQSLENSYRRFYLKNLAPVFRGDYSHLPLFQFLPFLLNSGEDFFSASKEFKECRKWVIKNKYRFKANARSVAKKWEK